MPIPEPALTMGIEEEYLVVDKKTRDLVPEVPPEVMSECQQQLGAQVSPEFLRSQIEIGTGVCKTISEAREDLKRLRRAVIEATAKHGLAPIAASTHPFASWRDQQHTDKDRYNLLARDMQLVVRRMLICGMHVHLGIEDEDLRIDLTNQLAYFLPHLLALSTSSPFWEGEVSGLKSFRLCVFDEMPRTGLPAEFESWAQYERAVRVMTKAGVLEDATKIWWDLRPSARFPTLEMRITDVCPLLEDALSIAALYQSLAHMLYQLRRMNQRWRVYPRMLIEENRWRAQRYGISEGLVDFGQGTITPYADLGEELIELLQDDAEALGCKDELLHIRNIIAEGTSADRQLRTYAEKTEAGMTPREALNAVVDQLIEETARGIDAG